MKQMSMKDLVDAIVVKHKATGIEVNRAATLDEVIAFENKIGFLLPEEFREFYFTCNGFGCTEDLFNVTSLEKCITETPAWLSHKENIFFLAEYMIHAEHWSFRPVRNRQFEIIYNTDDLVLTSSLHAFLSRYLQGGVYYNDGLIAWADELRNSQ
jgi:hypothetical protein